MMKLYVRAALTALSLALVSACSAGGDTASNKLAELEPAEARQRLMESGYAIDQNGFRQAVDYLDADAVALYVAVGMGPDAMADALSWPVEGVSQYHNPKFPGQLEESYDNPAYRSILATMFENGISPNEPLLGIGPSRFASRYTTSLFAESLRLGDEELISFLREFEADWDAKPGCYQHNPRCRNPGTMAAWLFYIPGRTEVWTLESSLAAYERLQALGADTPSDSAEDAGAASEDPYLMAALAYHKTYWSPENAQIDAMWQDVGSPRIIVPYGTDIAAEKRASDPDQARFASGRVATQKKYLLDKVFPCIADNDEDYYACLESPPAD